MRAIRALRPVRLLTSLEATREMLHALVLSFWSALNVIVCVFTILLVMAIVGVQLFGVRNAVLLRVSFLPLSTYERVCVRVSRNAMCSIFSSKKAEKASL